MRKKNYFSLNLILISLFSFSVFAAGEKRTDGPPGSEWGDFSSWDGQFNVGARFGALMQPNGDNTSFLVGADFDYRPTDLFGFKLVYEQSLQKTQISHIHFAPLVHTDFSNLKPFAFFGPGISFIHTDSFSTKFSMAFGAGGDFKMTEKWGFGMLWTYHWVFDTSDTHTIAARFSYWF